MQVKAKPAVADGASSDSKSAGISEGREPVRRSVRLSGVTHVARCLPQSYFGVFKQAARELRFSEKMTEAEIAELLIGTLQKAEAKV